jgi:hypothetical protein
LNSFLKSGLVIYGKFDFGNSLKGLINDSHYYIILNHSPDNDDLIVLVVGTSQVDKYTSRLEKGILEECDFHYIYREDPRHNNIFNKDTIINTSQTFILNKKQAIEADKKGMINNEILKEIKDKVRKNKAIERKYKKMI